MNTEILEYIKFLTSRDTKDLVSKTLKQSEECGELSGAVLAYTNASGSLHKVVSKEKILEECVDNILVALSIAYSLEFSDDDISDKMRSKSKYWNGIQTNEFSINSLRNVHELHLTIESVESLDYFKTVCKELDPNINVKPIVLDIHTKSNTILCDIMTSSIHIGNTASVFDKIAEYKNKLESRYGLRVIRAKIEVPPTHPSVPKESNNIINTNQRYFECHIPVIIDNTNENIRLVKLFAKDNFLHVSRNFFKRDENSALIMLTYRDYAKTYEEFQEYISNLKKKFLEIDYLKIAEEKVIIEYCIYDSNVHHDAVWTD